MKIGERREFDQGIRRQVLRHRDEPSDKEGDGIKVLDGDKSKVFAKGLNEPKGIAFTGNISSPPTRRA